ncbi:MAG: TLC domain-containing protein [Monoraphidium minutum]|nr:MAG: TLC domain-containing protein [Monoraphidium minutum]
MEYLRPLQDMVSPDTLSAAKTVGTMAVAWASLELISYILIRPYFMLLLDNNPKLAGDAKAKGQTATQMLPRVVCFVHNVVQVPLGLMILTDPAFYSGTSRLLASSDFSTLVMAISAGYFAYDTLECIVRYEHEGPEFLLHGVFCFIVFSTLTAIGRMHWFGAGFLMWELSTPFMHFRWVLYKIARDKTTLYVVNGVMGLATFFLCRICWGPVLSLLYWKDSLEMMAGPQAGLLPAPLVWVYRFCTLVMNGLNLFWFQKMVKLALDGAARGARKKKAA